MSKFNSLEELEENLTVKQMKNGGAKEFYLDETKPMSERIKVFQEYGIKKSHIYRPTTVELRHIFEWFYEQEYISKMQTMSTLSVIEAWMWDIKLEKINVWKGMFDQSERNYDPSEEALKRLKNYYLNKLMKEGVSKFTYDW